MAFTWHVALCVAACLAFALGQNAKTVDQYLQEIDEFTAKNRDYKHPGNNLEYLPEEDYVTLLPPVDFVVIGVGTAGAIVTGRLAENRKFTIMALEAGTYGNVLTNITALSYMLTNSPYNWGYKSEPNQNAALGVKDQVVNVPRGKGFGGTTNINGVRYVRNSKYDWAKVVAEGNPGWDYDTMLEYFKKSERSIMSDVDEGYHGSTGPQVIEHAKDSYVQSEATIKGLNELNYSKVDFNGREHIGVGYSQLMSENGIRYSTARGYIEPILNARHVQLMDKAFVLKIEVDPYRKTADSVLFSRNNRLFRVQAKREVVLCAGAINSPQILQLSGIGPREELDRLNINVIEDLPVGKNLTDHPLISVAYVNFKNYSLPNKTLRQHLEDFVEGRGELAVGTGMRTISFHKTKHAGENDGADISPSYKIPTTYNKPNKTTSNYLPEVYDAVFKDVDLNSAINIQFMIHDPKSRGTVTLKSSSPYEHPIIHLNLLDDPQDVEVALEGTKLMMKLVDTPTFKSLGAKRPANLYPACRTLAFTNMDQYYKCAAKQITSGGMHIYNTCRMGPDPSNAVVDSELKVHGIKKLRVVDASVISYCDGWPMAVVMAVAEKAADMIKDDHRRC